MDWRKQTVSKEVHKKLPQAGRVRINWHWWWFKNAFNEGWKYCFPLFMKTRGANYGQVWIGPFTVMYPLRWLEGPARQLHPKVFSEVQPTGE